MKKTKSLAEALRTTLPKMIKNEKALEVIIDILEEKISSGEFDMDSTIAKEISGKGSFDEFGISIHEFYGIYWITAPEFDDEGYFTSLEDAILFAEDRYEPYIRNAKDEEQDS